MEELEIDYGKSDYDSIVKFLVGAEGTVSVREIIIKSGANYLRVYPTLFSLILEGKVEVVEQTELGSPLVVRYIKK